MPGEGEDGGGRGHRSKPPAQACLLLSFYGPLWVDGREIA